MISTTEVTTCSRGYYSSGYSKTGDSYTTFNICVCFVTIFMFITSFSFINFVSFIDYFSLISFIKYIRLINYLNFISFIIGFSGCFLRPVS